MLPFHFQISMDFWSGYQEAADTFLLGEVWSEDEAFVGEYQQHIDSVFNFPSVLTTNTIFHEDQPMSNLQVSIGVF